MLNDTEIDRLWEGFDPFQYHSYADEFCPECFMANKMCHKCGELLHNSLITVSDDEGNEELMSEWLCEFCADYHLEEYRERMI